LCDVKLYKYVSPTVEMFYDFGKNKNNLGDEIQWIENNLTQPKSTE